MTEGIIDITKARKSRKEDPGEVDPEDLLTILRRWKATDSRKYAEIVRVICSFENIDWRQLI